MNDEDGSDCDYTYPNSDQEQDQEQEQEYENDQGQEYEQEQEQNYQDFYTNLEVMTEQQSKNFSQGDKNKNKLNKVRSLSIDSEASDIIRPNFRCGSCRRTFLLDKNQKMIRCMYCGYRILFKLRTRSYITYKTE